MSSRSAQIRQERLAGLLLIAAAAIALLLANGPFADAYHHALEARVGPVMPRHGVMSIHEWIADALMALFFLLVGREVKREWYEGALNTAAERRLPIIAAIAGVFAAIYAVVRLKLAPMPHGTNWRQVWGAACLCGTGFTMSLFIGALAFPADPALVEAAKIGTLAGSLLSALAGFLILRTAPVGPSRPDDEGEYEEVFAADEPDDRLPRRRETVTKAFPSAPGRS